MPITSPKLVVLVMPPHIRRDIERPEASRVVTAIRCRRGRKGTPEAPTCQKIALENRRDEVNSTDGELRCGCDNES